MGLGYSVGRKVPPSACRVLALAGFLGAGVGTGAVANPIALLSEPLVFSVGTIDLSASTVSFATLALTFPVSLEAKETPATIEVTLAADVLFDFDKADIKPAAESALHELARMIRDKAHGATAIHGYTDGLGGEAYNQRLSERRAASVKAWLVAHEKLEGTRLSTAGFGARDPVAANRHQDGLDDPEGRQRNRRVTVIIRK